jgi:hypothetical protein
MVWNVEIIVFLGLLGQIDTPHTQDFGFFKNILKFSCFFFQKPAYNIYVRSPKLWFEMNMSCWIPHSSQNLLCAQILDVHHQETTQFHLDKSYRAAIWNANALFVVSRNCLLRFWIFRRFLLNPSMLSVCNPKSNLILA